jgi:DNA (cytosine-5)-methyltransferase 1
MATKCETEILTLDHYLQLKKDGFEFEGQSYLFWEFMRLLNEVKPKYFLLENVEMGAKWEKVLSKAIGVNGIHINSALVSAQNRKRIYWTNIGHEPGGLFGDLVCKIKQPKDRGILLKDILEPVVDEKYFLSEKMIDTITKHGAIDSIGNDKSNCILSNYFKMGGRDQQYTVHNTMPRSSTTGKGGTGPLSRNDGKTYCLDTGNTNAVEIVAMRGRENGQQLEANGTGKTNCLTSVQKDNLVSITEAQKLVGNRSEDILHTENDKLHTLCSENGGKVRGKGLFVNSRIRRLTPTECERLQTVVPDGYTSHVSDSQRYKMLGNGWTVSVIAHIFSYISTKK